MEVSIKSQLFLTKRYLPKEFITKNILDYNWYIFGLGMGGMVLCSLDGLTHSSRTFQLFFKI